MPETVEFDIDLRPQFRWLELVNLNEGKVIEISLEYLSAESLYKPKIRKIPGSIKSKGVLAVDLYGLFERVNEVKILYKINKKSLSGNIFADDIPGSR
ncbi:hypothetical protein, partial [Caulobacter sp. HMWF025]|uniref:hypothetical protein n=2 Tax=unclassified Caulobacter TaxID=2648921 RepID=UPI0011B1ED1A